MIKIAFFGPWWTDCEQINKAYFQQTPDSKGIWGNIQAVSSFHDADYYIIIQEDTKISQALPSHKKIYIQREPDTIIPNKVFNKNKGAYLASFDNSYQFSVWWVEKNYDELKQLQFPVKTKALNTIQSLKQNTTGQKLRTEFALNFKNKYPEAIDIYGSLNTINTERIKKLPLNKLESTINYRYSFVAENSQQDNYFSEKIVDAYLSWSMPIYWGCPNILKYFPKDSLHIIDITKKSALDDVFELSQKPLMQTNVEAINQARSLILDTYNIWPSIHNIINNKLR